MPKRTTSIGPQQMNCSDGAKMLIDQMKEHPEEFRGYAGKFTNMLDTAYDVQHNRAIRGMSARDSAAILAAAETHLYEVWLAEEVLTKMMAPKVEKDMVYATPVKSGLWQGAVPPGSVINIPNNMANIGSSNISQYGEQEYQRELARYKMEQRDREALKRQENEHAMRSTKPFKGFL